MTSLASMSSHQILDFIPTVHTQDGRREYMTDLFSRMLKDRVVFLTGGIDDMLSNLVVSQLLFLENENPEAPIQLFINSPGGSVTSGLAIFDTMNFIKPAVHTFCMGQAASMGAFLLGAGEPGHRYILPSARVMIHQPLISGGLSGQATDIEIHAREIIKMREQLERVIAQYTGKTLEQVHLDCERDRYMSAQEAVEYGMVDQIVAKRP